MTGAVDEEMDEEMDRTGVCQTCGSDNCGGECQESCSSEEDDEMDEEEDEETDTKGVPTRQFQGMSVQKSTGAPVFRQAPQSTGAPVFRSAPQSTGAPVFRSAAPQSTGAPVFRSAAPQSTGAPVFRSAPQSTGAPVFRSAPQSTGAPVFRSAAPQSTGAPVFRQTQARATGAPVFKSTAGPVFHATGAPVFNGSLRSTAGAATSSRNPGVSPLRTGAMPSADMLPCNTTTARDLMVGHIKKFPIEHRDLHAAFGPKTGRIPIRIDGTGNIISCTPAELHMIQGVPGCNCGKHGY